MDKYTCQCIQKKFFKNEEYILFSFYRVTMSIYKSYRLKLTLLDHILHNTIATKEMIEKRISFINRYNKIHNAIAVLQRKWKLHTYKKYDFETDIDGTPLNEYKDDEIYKVIQNKTVYTFTLYDMLNIVRNALLKNDYLTPHPLFPKNPFTNVYFSKTDIYAMYLKCKRYNIQVDYFIEQFVRKMLELRSFLCENNFKLTQYAIRNYIYYTADEYIYDELYNMFSYLEIEDLYDVCQIDIRNRFVEYIELVEPEFVSQEYMKWIIDICKDMLHPYFMHLYKTKLYDESVDNYYLVMLGNKITHACYNNPNFWLKNYHKDVNKETCIFGTNEKNFTKHPNVNTLLYNMDTIHSFDTILDNPPDFSTANPNKWKMNTKQKQLTTVSDSNSENNQNIIIEVDEMGNQNTQTNNDSNDDKTTIVSFSDLDSDIEI